MENWDSSQIELLEQFKVLLLNRANKVLGLLEVSTGGISGTVADPKIIFTAALKGGASGIIVAHNHPSGVSEPSRADKHLTDSLRSALGTVDIPILDHFIVARGTLYSFAEKGLL